MAMARGSSSLGKERTGDEEPFLSHTPPPEFETSSSSSSSPDSKLRSAAVLTSNNMASSYEKSVSVLQSDKVPVWKKLVYATGSMPYAMINTVVGFYFSIFLLEAVIMSPAFVLVIVFSGRVWDAITDPIVGYLISLTRTRFGRLRPWLGLAAVPTGVILFFMWFSPIPDDQPQYVKYFYYQIMYLLLQASLTCIHVPYTALTMHISNDNKQRDSVTLYRMIFEAVGTLIGIGVYTIYFVSLVGSTPEDCDGGERLPDPARRAVFQWMGFTLGLLTIACVSITVIGIKEQKEEARVDKKIGFFKGLKEICGFKPYINLIFMELFSWMALQFIQGNTALFLKYSVGLGDQYPYVITILLVCTVLCMPLSQLLILKFGKKTAFYVGMWSILPLLLFMLFLDRFPYGAYPLNAFAGLGVATAFLLPWSMLSDVVDEAALKTGVRREELFYAFFVFGNKFGSGVTLGISQAVLKIAGYDEYTCEQPWTVNLTLKLMMTVPSVILVLLSLPFLHFYPLNTKSIEKTKQLLATKRQRRSTSDDSPYVADRHISPAIISVKERNEDASEDNLRTEVKFDVTDSQQTDL